MTVVPKTVRRLLKSFLVRAELWERTIGRIEDGRLILDPSICIPNFIFQRILGVNRSCPWPVHYTSRVMHPQNIRIGSRVAFSFAVSGGVYIQANNGVVFGDDVIFGPGVKIISANHDPANLDSYVPAPAINIGDRCWIGANAVILPGVTLGRRVIVGAGAVVTKSFPDNAVVVGNPARIIRYLDTRDFSDEALSEALKISAEERFRERQG